MLAFMVVGSLWAVGAAADFRAFNTAQDRAIKQLETNHLLQGVDIEELRKGGQVIVVKPEENEP
jgi:hypothetical protein